MGPFHRLAAMSALCYPSTWSHKKEQLANQIYKATGLRTDDVLSVLPGASDVLEDVGIFTPFKSNEEE